MINIIRAVLRLFGLLTKVKAHTRMAGSVPVVSYWRWS